MIFSAKDRIAGVRTNPLGGTGELRSLDAFARDRGPEGTCFQMVAENTLAPGASIGFHVHQDNEEVYVIVRGQGLYTDTDKNEYPVGPGDITLTRRGEGHGLKQTGDEPLTFLAVIAV